MQDVFLGAWMITRSTKGIYTLLWTQHGMAVVLPLPEKPLRSCCMCSSDLMAVVLVERALITSTKLVKAFLRLIFLLGFV